MTQKQKQSNFDFNQILKNPMSLFPNHQDSMLSTLEDINKTALKYKVEKERINQIENFHTPNPFNNFLKTLSYENPNEQIKLGFNLKTLILTVTNLLSCFSTLLLLAFLLISASWAGVLAADSIVYPEEVIFSDNMYYFQSIKHHFFYAFLASSIFAILAKFTYNKMILKENGNRIISDKSNMIEINKKYVELVKTITDKDETLLKEIIFENYRTNNKELFIVVHQILDKHLGQKFENSTVLTTDIDKYIQQNDFELPQEFNKEIKDKITSIIERNIEDKSFLNFT